MIRRLAVMCALALSCVVTAGSAAAQSFVFPLSAASQVSNSSKNDGNGRIFKGMNGTELINVRVSGWSFDGSRVQDSYVGLFEQGLGVTSGDDNGGWGNQHTIDNKGRWDFLIFQFDTPVQLASATFSPYKISGVSKSGDTDATVAFGDTSTPWTNQLALNNTSISSLNAIFTSGLIDTLGTQAQNTRPIYAGTAFSDIWLIGATKTKTDKYYDSFKLSNLVVNVPAVPEPSTWAMMMLGLGLIGFSLRRAKEAPTAAMA